MGFGARSSDQKQLFLVNNTQICIGIISFGGNGIVNNRVFACGIMNNGLSIVHDLGR